MLLEYLGPHLNPEGQASDFSGGDIRHSTYASSVAKSLYRTLVISVLRQPTIVVRTASASGASSTVGWGI